MSYNTRSHRFQRVRLAPLTVCLATLVFLAGCTGDSMATEEKATEVGTPRSGAAGSSSSVLPVKENPISNTSTAEGLTIESVLVENNVASDGDDAPDHLEIALRNEGGAPLTSFEVYYTIADPKTKESESYYARLPDSFTVPKGARRVAHFDGTQGTDHFPVNKFSLYYTDTNALDVTVQVSATNAMPRTLTVKKDAGGAEEAD